jgi:REP element-mobilizing transposase RayT
MVTRTTIMSLFLLAPGRVVNQVMEYCMAWAAKGTGVKIHAMTVESTHYHALITDYDGDLHEFMREFDRTAARCLLEYYRKRFPNTRFDALWDPSESYSAVLMINRAAVWDALDYIYTNPVKDGLVRDFRKWPGFNTRPAAWKKGPLTAKRPEFYFKNTPKTIQYQLTAPEQLGGELDDIVPEMETRIRDAQQQAAINLAAAGRTFLGVKALLRISPLDAPTSRRPYGNLNPHLAAGGDPDALKTAKLALRQFRYAYRLAWLDFKSKRAALFPAGTLLMRIRHHLACVPLDVHWCLLAGT